jgi:hypothetical protein
MVLGKNALKSSLFSSGHPNGENGNNPLNIIILIPEENHVSNTSSSYLRVNLDLSTLNCFSAF